MKLVQVCAVFGLGLILFARSASAIEVIGATPGTGGDTVETTFHFDANSVDFQMTRSDGTPLSNGNLPLVYGSSMQIFNNGEDWVAKKNLQVMGGDLSGTSWTSGTFPDLGELAIDPATGRFLFAASDWENMGYINSTVGALSGIPSQVAIHSDGSAICVYQQSGSGNGRVYAKHFEPDTGWQDEIIIDSVESVPGNHASNPKIAMDGSGRAICVFTQNSPTAYYQPYANVFLPGVGWQGATRIDAGQNESAVDPRIVMNNDRAICVFQQVYNGKKRVYANEYTPTGGWAGALTIDADNTVDNISPLIAMNDNGQAFCVFNRETIIRTYANAYVPGSGWQGAVAIDAGSTSTNALDISMDNSGRAICLALVVAAGPLYITQAIEYAPAAGWGAPTVLAASGTIPSLGEVALNQAGRGLAAYVFSDTSNYRIYSREFNPASGWSNAIIIDAGPGQDALYPEIALNDQGKAVCVFRQSDGTNDRTYANHYTVGQGWSGAQVLDAELGYDTENAEIALNEGGEAFCIWKQSDGVLNRVAVSRFRVDIPSGTLQVRYHYDDTPAVTLPTENSLTIANRKIEPLKGGKVSLQLALAQAGKTTIKIYTLQGRLVKTLANEYLAAGNYTYDWAALNDAGDLIASGVYIIRVQAPGISETQKIVVIK